MQKFGRLNTSTRQIYGHIEAFIGHIALVSRAMRFSCKEDISASHRATCTSIATLLCITASRRLSTPHCEPAPSFASFLRAVALRYSPPVSTEKICVRTRPPETTSVRVLIPICAAVSSILSQLVETARHQSSSGPQISIHEN